MARYEREFSGMPAWFEEPGDLDPNFARGYGGMRMHGGRGRAAYGNHRRWRQQDLETEGGFSGIHGVGPGRPPHDPGWEERGGMGDSYGRGRVVRDFDSRSPRFARPARGRYADDFEGRERFLPARHPHPPGAYSPRYSNRGVTDAGYSEGWAFGPMRGAR